MHGGFVAGRKAHKLRQPDFRPIGREMGKQVQCFGNGADDSLTIRLRLTLGRFVCGSQFFRTRGLNIEPNVEADCAGLPIFSKGGR